jgi:hypothetical protein
MSCGANLGKYRWFWTGNQVGDLNFTGDFNFVAGGPKGSGISAGTLVRRFFLKDLSRRLWEYPNAKLNQQLLDASFPFIELRWIADIKISNAVTFRVSDRNIYVTDSNGNPRFYEARAVKAPNINITLGEWLAPNFEVGDFKIDLNNRDGFFNDWLPQGEKYLQWIGSEVSIKVGFGEKLDNYYEVFRGYVSNKQGVTGTHEIISIKCYDRTYEDEIVVPTMTFDKTNFPNVDVDNVGKVLPIVYGDWSEEVSEYGDIPAYCGNAYDPATRIYNWIISENPLIEIGDVYLHRGDAVPGKDGPILLLENAIIKQPELGRVIIPNDVTALSRVFILLDRARAGAGSGDRSLLSESSSLDFVKLGIRAGDVVLRDGDPINYTILSVGAGAITTDIGFFNPNDNYRIITDKYVFKKGDKISVTCKGKDLRVLSATKISDAKISNANPRGLAIGLDGTYWYIDNTLKKIIQVTFNNKKKREIKFEDIDPAITFVSSIAVAFDETLWLVDRPSSTFYRYMLKDNALGLSFNTIQVEGINQLLSKIDALTIDDANIITIVDNMSGMFYKIDPFSPLRNVVASWHRSVFSPESLDIIDIAADVNLNEIVILDRSTNKVFRVNELNGEPIIGTSFDCRDIHPTFTFPNGLGYYVDGTIFILNRNNNTIYNYNEFPGCSNNIGFIARDLLQKFAGKTTFDFDLLWNQTARKDLFRFKARAYIDEKITVINHINKMLQSFNTAAFIRQQKYGLFHIAFNNFRTDGDIIREGDIKLSSFNPSKEYNQYFNTSTSRYRFLPFTGISSLSDTYTSPAGVKMSGRAITKELDFSSIYRREDVDRLMPLFVRLAAAEPEFINLSVGFRFLFVQPFDFFNIRFFDYDPGKKSGRRYDNIPSFVRKVEMNLGSMEIKLKLWSLGTTAFGNFMPVGTTAGGQYDEIILTNLGTPGWISPVGTILSSNDDQITLEDVEETSAQFREASQVGKAWNKNYVVSIIDGTTHLEVETLIIDNVNEGTIVFTTPIQTEVIPTIRNSAGFIVGGHYLKYASYDKVIEAQTKRFSYFTRPYEGYPVTTTEEIEEQRAGKHNFEDQRIPYILHPKEYIPQL